MGFKCHLDFLNKSLITGVIMGYIQVEINQVSE